VILGIERLFHLGPEFGSTSRQRGCRAA
jgi:hypothetical protein